MSIYLRAYYKIGLIISIALLPLSSDGHSRDIIYDLLMDASKGGMYSPVSDLELKDAERLFVKLFDGVIDDEARRLSSSLGFKLIEIGGKEKRMIILKEDDDKKRGRGFFIFRQGSHNDTALQIPHAFTDLHTREIGMRVFIDTPAHAISFNTIRRSEADMAHLEKSYFIAFATAFAMTHRSGYLVQIHGFSKEKRVTSSGRGSDIIISSGRAETTSIIMKIYRCLKEGMDGRVSLSPSEVKELEARTNSIAERLNRMGYDRFVHIEMSKELRETLKKDKMALEKIERCIP